MEKMKVAVIGCGVIAEVHMQVLRACPLTEVIALCDTDVAKAERLAKIYGHSPAIYSDWRRMLDEAAPEAVHVCTPHYLHAEMACEALRRGIHVYLEKPIAVNDAEIDRLLAAEKASKAKITVSFQNRLIPRTQTFLRAIREGGGAVAGRSMVTWLRGKEYYTADDWHGRLAKEGGGLMINQAIHELDLMLRAFGDPPISVQGSTMLYENAAFSEVEDNAEFILHFPGDRAACFYGTNNFPVTAPNFSEVICKDGSRITMLGDTVLKNGAVLPIEGELPPLDGKACWGSGHLLCIGKFYEAIAQDTEVPVSLASAAVTLRTIFALYRSKNQRIPLDLR